MGSRVSCWKCHRWDVLALSVCNALVWESVLLQGWDGASESPFLQKKNNPQTNPKGPKPSEAQMKHLNDEGTSRELLKYKADESTALVFLQPLTLCPALAAAGVGTQCLARWCWALLVLPGTRFEVRAASVPGPKQAGGFGSSPLLCFLSLSPRPQNSHLVMERCVTLFLDNFLQL